MITDFKAKDRLVQIGNRNDVCYLCALEVTGKDEREYRKKMSQLKGSLEGKPVVKIKKNGTETAICLNHIHKIAKENPLTNE